MEPSGPRDDQNDSRRVRPQADLTDAQDENAFDGGFGVTAGVRVYSTDELRGIDRLCAEAFGLPTLVLMEHASSQLSEAAMRLLSIFNGSSALIVCGPGNNGGDGLASARHLDAMGVDVGVVLSAPGEAFTGDAAIQLEACRKAELPIVELAADDGAEQVDSAIQALFSEVRPTVVIDALFGTGLSRAPEGAAAALIGALNALSGSGATVVSADVPSGLIADTGETPGVCVNADLTVTFAGLKRGFLALAAQPYLGEVVVAPIGAPGVLLERFGEAVEPDWADRFARDIESDEPSPVTAPAHGSRGASGPYMDGHDEG